MGGGCLSHKLLQAWGSVGVVFLCAGQPRARGEAARVGGQFLSLTLGAVQLPARLPPWLRMAQLLPAGLQAPEPRGKRAGLYNLRLG